MIRFGRPARPSNSRGPARRRRALAALAVGAALGAIGCSDAGPQGCPGDVVTVTVAGGSTTPDINWTPACPVAQLDVDDMTQGGVRVWRISGQNANVIEPPVRYGVTPTGAIQVTAPVALQAGREYRVTVLRFVGGGLAGGGVARFTP